MARLCLILPSAFYEDDGIFQLARLAPCALAAHGGGHEAHGLALPVLAGDVRAHLDLVHAELEELRRVPPCTAASKCNASLNENVLNTLNTPEVACR